MSLALDHRILVARHPAAVHEFTEVLWARLLREAEEAFDRAPSLASLFLDSIINQPSFEDAVVHRVASRLKNDTISLPLIIGQFHRAMAADPSIGAALRTDITAVYEFDPPASALSSRSCISRGSTRSRRIA